MQVVDWQTVEDLSLDEAAYLISGDDPAPLRHSRKMPQAASGRWLQAMKISIQSRELPAAQVVVMGYGSLHDYKFIPAGAVGAGDVLHTGLTRISVTDFIEWCMTARVPLPWPFHGRSTKTVADEIDYPVELQAAINAFQSIRADPGAVAGRSVKGALLAWLLANAPELSANARERVATVANWQPTGGAPKTPTR